MRSTKQQQKVTKQRRKLNYAEAVETADFVADHARREWRKSAAYQERVCLAEKFRRKK